MFYFDLLALGDPQMRHKYRKELRKGEAQYAPTLILKTYTEPIIIDFRFIQIPPCRVAIRRLSATCFKIDHVNFTWMSTPLGNSNFDNASTVFWVGV